MLILPHLLQDIERDPSLRPCVEKGRQVHQVIKWMTFQ
jgi:hypothetical protein